MKVSDRTKELRKSLANATVDTINRYLIERQLNQLEDDVVDALQAARQEGYDVGYSIKVRQEAANGKDGVDVEALQEARQAGYSEGYKEGLRMCNLPDKR